MAKQNMCNITMSAVSTNLGSQAVINTEHLMCTKQGPNSKANISLMLA